MHPKGSTPFGTYAATYAEHLAPRPRVLSLFVLKGAPKFTGIFAHVVNFLRDTEGCFLYGGSVAADQVTSSNAFREQGLAFFRKIADNVHKPIGSLTIDAIVMRWQWDLPLNPHADPSITYGLGSDDKSKPVKSGSQTDCRVENIQCDTR